MPQKSALGFLAAIVILACTFVLFSPTMGFDFVNWDDDMYVYENDRVQAFTVENVTWFFSHSYYHSYIPLTMLSHMIDFAIWRFNPSGHHLTNVILHALNAVWVFLLSLQLFAILKHGTAVRGFRELLFREVDRAILFPAAFTACLFAWHPLRVESVAWISDRKDLLCFFFLLPATIYYINYIATRGTPNARRWYVTAFVLFVLACFAKSVAVVVPVVFLLIDGAFLHRKKRGISLKSLVLEITPFVLVAVVVGVLAIRSMPELSTSDIYEILAPVQRMLLPFHNLVLYIGRTLFPSDLSPMYPLAGEGEMMASVALFAAVSAACLFLFKKEVRMPLFVLGAYIVLAAPSAGFASAVVQTTADRYSYLSTVPLYLPAGWILGTLIEKFQFRNTNVYAITGVAVLAAGFFGYLSLRQLPMWMNSETLWGRTIALYPTMPLPHNNYGLALQGRGALDKAEESFRRAIQLKPDYLEAHLNLGNIMFTKGNWDEAERLFLRASELQPNQAEVYNNLGVVANTKGNTLDALHWFRRSVEVNPEYAHGYFNLGVLYEKMGNATAATEALTKAARLGHLAAQHSLTKAGVVW
ncbi:MAG: tetratricopeptide repeat protein [Bacteroidetes bacterium]|nr:tetratricopeptide repeat protein [Bacteroidota bacterium]MCW5895648.1 tetratricopeptide repeat protein [Bacteroidota bacterium]